MSSQTGGGAVRPDPAAEQEATNRLVVGVLGLGLIGGSVAKRWAAEGGEVVGWSRSASTRRHAADYGIAVFDSVAEVVERADLILLATPLSALPATLDEVAASLPSSDRDPTITDVGSVKAPITEHALSVLPDPSIFVPGHPMAGTEHSGWDRADPHLFQARHWALAVDEPVDIGRWCVVASVVQRLGAHAVPVEIAAHDRSTALISHLPYAIAAGLSSLVAAEPDRLAVVLAAGSYRSATRVVAGDGRDLGVELAMENAEALTTRIGELQAWLGSFSTALQAGDRSAVEKAFRVGEQDDESSPRYVATIDSVPRAPTRADLVAAAADGHIVDVEAGGGSFRVGGQVAAPAVPPQPDGGSDG